ncbi:MAG: DUF2442 domain-containing protein [bacterium]
MTQAAGSRHVQAPKRRKKYPRLVHATPEERAPWRLIADGAGIHLAALDEDISVENLLAGRPSGESQRSLKRWLEKRPASPEQGPPSRRRLPLDFPIPPGVDWGPSDVAAFLPRETRSIRR